MESYLLKSSLCLLFLYLVYRSLLNQETNHQVKRFVGLGCIVFACIFLFIPVGIFSTPDTYPQLMNVVFMQGSEGIQEGISKVITEDVTNIYLTIYVVGVAIFGLRSLFGLFTLIRWYSISEKSRKWGFTVVKVKKEITPFTLFNLLFIGNKSMDEESMNTLIVHEQYHRDQYHSIDTLLLEILSIFFWFNPVVWLFRRDIKTVHEYMADAQVLNHGFNPINYQYLLFQTQTGISLQFGSHFSNKTNLKKRISMMNQQKNSSKKSFMRALLFIPVMGLILLASAFTEANNNLSMELQLLRQNAVQDTIPAKKEVKNEDFQFSLRKAYKSLDRTKPLFIVVEGKKERTVQESYMRKIDPKTIESINVIKGEAALKKYGKRGKNGVVVIFMKKKV